ncbi:hypothetical protein C2E20_1732 [Micractinium conductrix]|uniref:SGNH hydrolase-type esterase domain-containing protein n=1 Tax=Micractinium conductrix TaxID=554055 RepID=A0A2P6VLU4_9CHLO|nr:hypothetical protein C2E20_1732 [Micractinium conductrix]|eukprot:PSC75050.1 hypothetical protein C2E20_1732 [Micractinium conductrix]
MAADKLAGLLRAAEVARDRRAAWVGISLASVALLTALLALSSHGGGHLWNSWRAHRLQSPRLQPPQMPWRPLLTAEERDQGVAHYGGGARLRSVAAKLLAGQPIKAYAVGGSVTYGHGVEDPSLAYPSLFFRHINVSFPHRAWRVPARREAGVSRRAITAAGHRDGAVGRGGAVSAPTAFSRPPCGTGGHVLSNRGLPGSTSGITAPCVHGMVAADADLVVVEFSTNDSPAGWTSGGKHGFEALLRTLLALPGRPAVVLLHHYAWWKAAGDGRSAGLYYREPEVQLETFALYYDLPSLSLKAATWRLMEAGVEGFKVDGVLSRGSRDGVTGEPIPAAAPRRASSYLYLDTIHPGPNGHQVLAELLAGLLGRAVSEVAGGRTPAARWHPRLQGLPPPMIPNFPDSRASLCIQLEAFRGVVRHQRGFSYSPEKPLLPRFEEQKWGWSAEQPGAWLELEVDTRQPRGQPQARRTEVQLGHLRSNFNMGTALVKCAAGCRCRPSVLGGTSASRATVFRAHAFQVSQHARCRLRVTVRQQPGMVPEEGHKVMLAAVAVTHQLGD